MTLRYVVFDLDGTLVDSAPDMNLAVNAVLAHLGHDEIDIALTRDFSGRGPGAMLRKALEWASHARRQAIDVEHVEKLVNLYCQELNQVYEENIDRHTKTMPGTRALLGELCERGLALGVCSNKPEHQARLLLERLQIDHYFSSIIGGDSTGKAKPEAKPLLACLRRLGKNTQAGEDSLMIGDSIIDIRAAKGAGIGAIYLTSGYGPKAEENVRSSECVQYIEGYPVHCVADLCAVSRLLANRFQDVASE